MYLRKYIEGGKVLSIEQKGIERVIIISIGKGPQEYKLIIELFDEGNLIFTDKDFKIINALSQKRFRDREIVAGALYDGLARSPEAGNCNSDGWRSGSRYEHCCGQCS